MNWQKMKTAPMDGTEILVYVPKYGRMVARYDTEKKAWLSLPGNYKREPTRWAEIPEVPGKFSA